MLGSMPHVYVAKIADGGSADPAAERAQWLKLSHVVGAAPVVIGPALIRAGERSAFVTLKGVDPATEGSVTELPQRMTAGRFDTLAAPPDASGEGPRLDGIALGRDLAGRSGRTEDVVSDEAGRHPDADGVVSAARSCACRPLLDRDLELLGLAVGLCRWFAADGKPIPINSS